MRRPREYQEISRDQAHALLQFLFGSIGGKRRDTEESMAKLAACADIFSPASNTLGTTLGLWKPAPQHPVVLALAIA